MAKNLSNNGIVLNQTIYPQHVSQSVDAFTGADAYDITVSGSFTVTGSTAIKGDVNLDGPITMYGNVVAPNLTSTAQTNVVTFNPINGQLYYTASNAISPSTASNAVSASYSATASYAEYAVSASYAATASWAINAITASYVTTAQTASYVLNAVSASYATTASYVENAQTASYVENAQTASYVTLAQTSSYYDETDPVFVAKSASLATTGSNTFSGSQDISGSIHQQGVFYPDVIDWFSSSIQYTTGSYVLTTTVDGVTTYANYQDVATRLGDYLVTTTSFNSYTGSNTSQFAGTASYATQALSASYAPYTTGNLATAQARRTTGYTLPLVPGLITFDTTDTENQPSVISHDNTNTDRIYVYVDGLYSIHYHADVAQGTSANDFEFAVTKNTFTILNGSYIDGKSSSTDKIPVGVTTQEILAAGDYISLAARYVDSSGGIVNNAVLSVTKMEGVAGPQGPSGSAGTPGSGVTINNNTDNYLITATGTSLSLIHI